MSGILKFIISFSLVAVSLMPTFAQNEDEKAEEIYSAEGKGWVFGLNVGVYYPSKKTAAYYNGKSNNENNAALLFDNPYRYQEFFNLLNAHDTISIYGFPENMHYKLALQPGIYAQYCFNPTTSLIIEFNYMRLKVNDVLVIEVDPKPFATEPDLRLWPMRGIEERIYADIGLKKTFPKSEKLSYFLMGGLNVNSTQVKKCSFYIDETEYSMINNIEGSYVPNGNNQTVNVYQGGIGIGMFASGGVSLTFPGGIVVEPGLNTHLLMVKLKGYKNMNPGIGANLRFIF